MRLPVKFKSGDRVRMLKHGDWKNYATGTVVGDGRVRTFQSVAQARIYWIRFDEPQRDCTDEWNNTDFEYDQSNVCEQFLQPLQIFRSSA
jgi:hypothetical protein